MATNHTGNYQLNCWEANDKFIRTEFNENFGKIDAALAEKAEAATLAQLQTVTDGKADWASHWALSSRVDTELVPRPRILTGSYTGNGNTTNTIDFGVPARLVLITTDIYISYFTFLIRGQTVGTTAYATDDTQSFSVEWGTNSVSLRAKSNAPVYAMNQQGFVYYWCVFY